jgi:predicted O-methyltransferase YrrM
MACGPTEIGVLAVVFRRMLADLHELLSRKFGYLQHSRLEYAAGWTRERSEMKAIDVEKAVGNLPYMSRDEADYLHSFFDDNGIRSCLELGFFHGVSSAYIAAKMAEVGGHLTTIDRIAAKQRQPNIDQLLEKLNLSEVVTVIYEPRSYTWALMKLLEGSTTEQFDFVFVDGGHGWDNTALAFFLVAKLLKPGGWVVFDDLGWTLADSRSATEPWALKIPEEERKTPTVTKVYELLVQTDERFGEHFTRGKWGFARKKK